MTTAHEMRSPSSSQRGKKSKFVRLKIRFYAAHGAVLSNSQNQRGILKDVLSLSCMSNQRTKRVDRPTRIFRPLYKNDKTQQAKESICDNIPKMFRSFSTGLFLLHGTMLTLVATVTLTDFRAALKNATINVQEFQAITSASNAGSFCVTGRFEPGFMLAFALQLLCAGWYMPVESRSVAALAAAVACAVLAHSCYLITTNTLSVQVFQGDFVQLLEGILYMNGVFAVLYAVVAMGTFLGLADNNNKAKTE